jgi:hypothetical protein
MPPQSNNSSPGKLAPTSSSEQRLTKAGVNYWYGSNSLPDALEGLPQDPPNNPRMMRRASEAVVQAGGFQRCVCDFSTILISTFGCPWTCLLGFSWFRFPQRLLPDHGRCSPYTQLSVVKTTTTTMDDLHLANARVMQLPCVSTSSTVCAPKGMRFSSMLAQHAMLPRSGCKSLRN